MKARDPSVRRVVIDHINLPVRDLAASRTFYEAVLATLGFGVQESEGWVAFGPPGSAAWLPFAVQELAGAPGGPLDYRRWIGLDDEP